MSCPSCWLHLPPSTTTSLSPSVFSPSWGSPPRMRSSLLPALIGLALRGGRALCGLGSGGGRGSLRPVLSLVAARLSPAPPTPSPPPPSPPPSQPEELDGAGSGGGRPTASRWWVSAALWRPPWDVRSVCRHLDRAHEPARAEWLSMINTFFLLYLYGCWNPRSVWRILRWRAPS